MTLDGLTGDEFYELCARAAHRAAKAELATSFPRPLNKFEELALDLGVMVGIKATFDELARRNLIWVPGHPTCPCAEGNTP